MGRIPIVNLAFRKKDTKREATELIAFITPTVLRGLDSDRSVTREAVSQLEVIEDWHTPLEIFNGEDDDLGGGPAKQPSRSIDDIRPGR